MIVDGDEFVEKKTRRLGIRWKIGWEMIYYGSYMILNCNKEMK